MGTRWTCMDVPTTSPMASIFTRPGSLFYYAAFRKLPDLERRCGLEPMALLKSP